MSRHPEILWAQRSDKVYLTIAVLDAKDVCLKCEPEGTLNFSAVGAHDEKYECKLELFGSISPEGSKTKVGLRNILCTVKKEQKEWWARLLKSEEKPAAYIKVDWNKWCDEDDPSSDAASDEDTEQYNDEGSDDDGLLYLPDLEKFRGK